MGECGGRHLIIRLIGDLRVNYMRGQGRDRWQDVTFGFNDQVGMTCHGGFESIVERLPQDILPLVAHLTDNAKVLIR